MKYIVKIWIENGIIKCASQVCTKDSCPRFNLCQEVEIKF